MSTAITITRVSEDGSCIYFNVALSGNYVAGGDTLDFTNAKLDAAFQGSQWVGIPISSLKPVNLACWIAGADTAAHAIAYIVSAVIGAMNACKLIMSASATPGTEFSAGAYSAAEKALLIEGCIVVQKLL